MFFFFNSKEATLNRIVDNNEPYKSFALFIWKVTSHKGLELGKYKSITNLKELGECIPYHLT
jgi:hypothetical protein